MIDLTPLLRAKRQVGSVRGLISRWFLERHNQLASIGVPQAVLTQIVAAYREWTWK